MKNLIINIRPNLVEDRINPLLNKGWLIQSVNVIQPRMPIGSRCASDSEVDAVFGCVIIVLEKEDTKESNANIKTY